MFPAIKRYMYFFTGWSFVLQGCFLHSVIGPGYAVDIKVTCNETLKIEDIKFLEDIVTTEGFKGKRVTPSDKWECVHFIKDKPQIQVGYSYDREKHLVDNAQVIRNLRVMVSNDWKGQEPALKQEIDRLADIFYKELSNRLGIENIHVERMRTGPPF